MLLSNCLFMGGLHGDILLWIVGVLVIVATAL